MFLKTLCVDTRFAEEKRGRLTKWVRKKERKNDRKRGWKDEEKV